MKRSGFRKKTPDEIKQVILKKKAKMAQSTSNVGKTSGRGQIRAKKATPKSLQKKCDDQLTPIIKKLFPKCLLCPNPTQVAHHHVHKSKSLILRYDLDNLINLCNSCHFALHQNESYHASRIVQIKGLAWFEGLQKKKDQIIRTSPAWYEEKLEWLKQL